MKYLKFEILDRSPAARPAPRAPRPAFRGFTLIDLLVAVTIIAILATIGLGALNSARESARVAKTQATVTKLHYLVMNKYDSYRTRRLPISIPPGTQPNAAAQMRLNAVRDLMRMEMPDRWSDVYKASAPGNVNAVALFLPTAPSLTHRYRRIYFGVPNPTDEYGAAECLYMIVSAIPGAMEQFHASEIGDVDGDGLPEFIDAWGRPIRFIRWPAGFFFDDHEDFFGDGEIQFGPDPLPCGDPNPNFQHDPFDSTRITRDYALFPLIYSAGPDGEYDINVGRAGSNTSDTYAYSDLVTTAPTDSKGLLVGQPKKSRADDDDPSTWFTDLRHYDNIHNHRSP